MCEDKKCVVCTDTFHSRISNYEGEHKGEILCNKHLLQIKRNGIITDSSKSRRRDTRNCDICGNENKIRQFGFDGIFKGYLLCQKHYAQARDHGEITDPTISQALKERVCEHCGSEDRVTYWAKDRMMLCRRHWDHMYNYGKILTRTVFDKNEILSYEDYAEVIMYDAKQNETGRAIIDIDTIKIIQQHKWSLNNWGYADSRINDEIFTMQNFLFGKTKKGQIVDHIDRNPLNNRMNNLRIANKSQNGMNAKLSKKNTSGVKGVSFSKRNNQWRAYITYDGEREDLGLFQNKDDAIRKRLLAEMKYHREYSSQKHLYEKYLGKKYMETYKEFIEVK